MDKIGCNKEFACTYSVVGGKFYESKRGSCNFASAIPVISVTEGTLTLLPKKSPTFCK